jgi:hypothetical protein
MHHAMKWNVLRFLYGNGIDFRYIILYASFQIYKVA